MISFDEASALVEQHKFRPGTEVVRLEAAHGRVLAEDVTASFPLPRFANSSMDGYAVSSAAGPWTVAQVVAAGSEADALQPGCAARVFTGAPIPAGTFAVVAQEDVTTTGDQISSGPLRSGRYIRCVGEDVSVGQVVATTGSRIDPPVLAASAAVGRSRLTVKRRARVLLLITGDELATPGLELGPAQVYDCIGPALSAALTEFGAVVATKYCLDQMDPLVEAVSTEADLILSVGGASVGDRDLVRGAMAVTGFDQVFSRVSMKPGRPVTLATRGETAWLALPGNPMSSLVTFSLFAATWLGRAPAWSHMQVTNSLSRETGREEFAPCRIRDDGVEILTNPGSHSVVGMVSAQALARIPADVTEIVSGTRLPICRFPWRAA